MGTTATAEEAEKFADEMISRSPRIDALNFILLSESGKEAFMEFLREEYVQDNLWFFKVSFKLFVLSIVDEISSKSSG